MRLFAAVVALAVLTCAGKHQDGFGPAGRIRIVSVPSDQHLPCVSAGRIHACTVFAIHRLEHRCRAQEDRWQLDLRIEIDAVIYLPQTRWLRHERDHIDDVLAAVEEHRQHLAHRRYESADACERSAAAEKAGLSRQLSMFIEASNNRLD